MNSMEFRIRFGHKAILEGVLLLKHTSGADIGHGLKACLYKLPTA